MNQFLKSQCSSVFATTADFLITILMKELMGVSYLISHCLGMMSGGIVHFTLNKKWVFMHNTGRFRSQLSRYLLVWVSSFAANVALVWLLTDVFELNYLLSKLLVAALLAVTVNYLIQKKYVFQS